MYATIVDRTGWTMEEVVGNISQRQLVLLFKGWCRLNEELGDLDVETEGVNPFGEDLGDPDWFRKVLETRGVAITDRSQPG